jgi:hypothetical protein
MTQNDFDLNEADGKRNQAFNNKLQAQLEQLVFEIDKNDTKKQRLLLEEKPSPLTKIILFIPAIIGWLIHAPLYLPIKKITYKKTRDNDHYDSVLVASLLFIYPLYLVLLTAIAILLTKNFYFLLLTFALPFTAWAYVQLKQQLDNRTS